MQESPRFSYIQFSGTYLLLWSRVSGHKEVGIATVYSWTIEL